MSEDKKYNGWNNYETWNVALWLNNEEGSEREMSSMADEVYLDAVASSNFTKEDQAVLTLADRIKSYVEDQMPDLGASCFADLLNAAVGEVDWHEIAQNYIDDCDKSCDEVEETADTE